MKLRAKSLRLVAGRPVALLNEKTARLLNVHVDERVSIKSDVGKQVIAVVDTIFLAGKDEIILSEEILDMLKIKEGSEIDVSHARRPVAAIYIRKKLDGNELSESEINEIIKSIVENKLTEAEIAYFVSALYREGMSVDEIVNLTRAIAKDGKKLGLKSRIIADKHGIGGIAGNRTTPIVVSICASAGLIMPKTSSRAITSAGGTADVIETIANVEFSTEEIKKIISKTGACLVWGGSLGLAPADDKIIQVERLLHLDPEAQLIASILAKKISVGATHVVLDIPYDKHAKVIKEKAFALEKKFHAVAKEFNIKLKTVVEKIEEPIGNGIGPVLEIKDVISVLKQEKTRPLDLEKRSLKLASMLLELTGKAQKGKGQELAEKILQSGKAYKKFIEIMKAQGGMKKLPQASAKKDIFAKKSGTIAEIAGDDLMSIARTAGAPADKAAGVYLYKHCKSKVQKGEKLLTIYAETADRLKNAVELCNLLAPVKIR